MPPVTHTREFRIRHYECDAYGHVHRANYVRYMQEAAFDASAAVGYGRDRYQEMGYMWLIRETDIEYLAPLVHGDTVEIKTWVDDFRRVRSRRYYEFRKTGTDEMVARANTDWIYIHTETLRPASIPPEMIEAFAPGGLPDSRLRDKFPAPQPPPSGTFKLHRCVKWCDVDSAGHMNNAVYFNYVEDCGAQVTTVYGWTMKRIREMGFAIITRRHRMEYRQPALFNDELEVSTWLSDMNRGTAIRHYTIKRTRDHELLARCWTLWAWLDC